MAFVNGKPHLNIELDQSMDLWTVKESLTFDPKDMFSNSILDLNPELEKVRDLKDTELEAFFRRYVNHIYEEKGKVLEKKKTLLQRDWDKIENNFINITQDLFNNHPWPEGAYVGFLSMFNCNPRFLNQKTFQCYYDHPEGLVYVSSHEMLHFMFYDYINKHNELIKDYSESNVWKLSEIFNVVVLGLSEFVRITGNPKPKSYPNHKDLIPNFTRLWNDTKQVDEFIEKSLIELK